MPVRTVKPIRRTKPNTFASQAQTKSMTMPTANHSEQLTEGFVSTEK